MYIHVCICINYIYTYINVCIYYICDILRYTKALTIHIQLDRVHTIVK